MVLHSVPIYAYPRRAQNIIPMPLFHPCAYNPRDSDSSIVSVHIIQQINPGTNYMAHGNIGISASINYIQLSGRRNLISNSARSDQYSHSGMTFGGGRYFLPSLFSPSRRISGPSRSIILQFFVYQPVTFEWLLCKCFEEYLRFYFGTGRMIVTVIYPMP